MKIFSFESTLTDNWQSITGCIVSQVIWTIFEFCTAPACYKKWIENIFKWPNKLTKGMLLFLWFHFCCNYVSKVVKCYSSHLTYSWKPPAFVGILDTELLCCVVIWYVLCPEIKQLLFFDGWFISFLKDDSNKKKFIYHHLKF